MCESTSVGRSVRRSVLFLAALGLAAEGVAAQDDMLVVTRGTDTIAVERVRRTGLRMDGELLIPQARARFNYSVVIGPGALVTQLENEFRRADADVKSPPAQAASLQFVGDSVFVEIRNPGAAARTQRIKTREGALPYINPSFALLEPMLLRMRTLGKDSLQIPVFFVAGGQTVDVTIKYRGPDSVVVSFAPGNDSYLKVDRQNRILGGTVPSQGLSITRSRATGQALFMPKPDYSAPAGAPYTAVDVTIPTPMGHTLAGTLTLPSGKGPFPALVTITGSGSQDRDEDIAIVKGYRPFRQIADTLARAGIAVLRMDDRGFGGSGGDVMTSTSADFADDIKAGLAWLRQRPEIEGRRLGLVGHSEGGLIAPMIAAEDPTLAAIVIMAGPAQTGRQILTFQNRYAIERAPTIRPEARDSALGAALKGIDSVAGTSPWIRFFLDYDPLATAARVKVPTLILQGATDQQVTAEQAEALGQAIRSGGNGEVMVKVFPNANHLFVEDPSGNPGGYATLPTGQVRGDVIETLVSWLRGRLYPTR
ncbi:MAG TPA: alpha/beta fold hydrolase [Gemmatimonadales bacterium]